MTRDSDSHPYAVFISCSFAVIRDGNVFPSRTGRSEIHPIAALEPKDFPGFGGVCDLVA